MDPTMVRVGDTYFLSSSFLSDLRVFIRSSNFPKHLLFPSSPRWLLMFGLVLNRNVYMLRFLWDTVEPSPRISM